MTKSENEEVSVNLKEWCKKQNVTVKSVCEALSQDYPYFIQQVRGEKRFTVQMARRISEYTGEEVTIDDLIPYIRPTHCTKCKQLLPKEGIDA